MSAEELRAFMHAFHLCFDPIKVHACAFHQKMETVFLVEITCYLRNRSLDFRIKQ